MEILRGTSASSRVVYRIVKEIPAWDLYTIEYLRKGICKDGSEFRAWFPAYEPKNKIFTSITEARIAFNAFMKT